MSAKAISFWLVFSQGNETCSSKSEYILIESVTSGFGLLASYM